MRSGNSSACRYSSYSATSSPYRIDHIPNLPYFQPKEYIDQLFSFDDMPHAAKRSQQLPKFQREAGCDLIAASLIEQNNYLREQLRHSEKIIRELEGKLLQCRQQLANQKEAAHMQKVAFQNRTQQLRQEIIAIMHNSRLLEQEIRPLKNILTAKNVGRSASKPKKNTRSLQKFTHKQNHPLNRLDVSDVGEGRKVDELVDSIKMMHLKIMGMKANSLKDIWRWLKAIAQVYSGLRKWHDKFSGLNLHSKNDKFRDAVSEVFQILD